MAEEVTLGDVDLTTVRARTISGIVTLVSRSFLLQIVATGGFFALSIYLGRPEIGLFIAINDLVSILGYFSDVGLAASLIQKKEKVTLADLRTTFTIQQLLVVVLIGVVVLFLPWMTEYYAISGPGLWLLYSLLGAFFLASLKTIPSIVLERQVKFEVLAAVEVIETLVFYILAVVLAIRGAGVMAYAWAVIARGLVGTLLIYLLSPWRIGFGISKGSLKSLLSFGVPYQINSLVASVKDRFINIILWRIIGADGVGIIGWAQTWSQKPLRFIMDNVTRVTFPSFARLQDHPQELKRGIERTLFFISLLIFPMLAGMTILAPILVQLVPRWTKWSLALTALGLYAWNSAWASISTPLTNTLNALGKVKINTILMVMWTALTWILVPWLARMYGYNGVAYATAIIAVSSIVPVLIVQKLTHFSLLAAVGKPILATIAMGIVTWAMARVFSASWISLAANIAISSLVFVAAAYLLLGKQLVSDAQSLWHGFRKK